MATNLVACEHKKVLPDADTDSLPVIKNNPLEKALQKRWASNCNDRIIYLKSLYFRNLLLFIEEQLGLRQPYNYPYTNFIGPCLEIQTRNLLAYCDRDEDLFSFVSYMESRLLCLAKERINNIYRNKKLLLFLPIFGWIKIGSGPHS